MPKYVSYDEMMEILDNKYLLPFRKDERLRGLNGIDIVRCGDCKHLYNDADTGKACEFTNMGMKPDDFCSYGERSEKIQGLDYAENILDSILREQDGGEE